MNGRIAALLCGILLPGAPAANPLRQLDAALKELTAKVSPAVVQVLATGYGMVIDPTDPQKNLVRPLGVIAATITPELLNSLGALRIPTGVVVVARTADPTSVDLSSGDVIHSVNAAPVTSVEALRDLLAKLSRGDAVVLQVERHGGLEFVAFEMN